MKQRAYLRILSFILAFVMVLEVAPMQAFATGNAGESTGNDVTTEETATATQDAQIQCEVLALRTETEKHYRHIDGSFTLVQFQVPIHYEDNGQWVELDNTLEPVTMFDGTEVYQTINGDHVQAFASTLESGEIMTIGNGDLMISMSLWDGAQAAGGENGLESGMNEMSSGEISSVQQMVEETDEVADGAQTDPVTLTEFNRNAEALVLDSDGVALMSLINDSEDTSWTVDAAIEEISQRISSTVLYEDVYPGVDLQYDLHSYNVKESIILKEVQPETDTYAYGFLLQLDGLTPVLLDDGSIAIMDSDNEERYTIPAPYMVDSNEAYSDAVTYTLTQQTEGWLLTVQADESWLEDPARVYPVTIDPTIIETENESNVIAGTATTEEPSNWSDFLENNFGVGYNNNGFGQMEIFLKVTDLPEIAPGSNVIGAIVRLKLVDYMPNASSDTKSTIFVHEISSEFKSDDEWPTAIKWDERPEYGAAMDYLVTSKSQIGYSLYWDITRAAKKWYADPSTNYGLALTSDRDATTPYRAYFRHIDQAVVAVAYRDTTGTEPYYTYETQSAVRAGTGYVGDYASTLTVLKGDLSYDNVSMPFGFSHVFNSGLRNGELNSHEVTGTSPGIFVPDYSSMQIGKGWQLSLQESVLRTTIEGVNGENILYLVYRDGDGTSHFFTYDYEETEYKDEDGLGLSIWLPVDSSGTNEHYELRDEQGNKKHFRDGYLVYIEDANGNKVHLVYNGATYSSDLVKWGLVASENRLTSVILENAVGEKEQPTYTTICTLNYDGDYLDTIVDYAGRVTKYTYTNGYLTSITHPDGIKTTYTYDSAGNLTSMYDQEANYGIAYTYDNSGVIGMKEYTVNNNTTSYGVQVKRWKNGIQDTVYQYSGNDGSLGTDDDLFNHYAFDNTGRTINITTLADDGTILGISSGAYVVASGQDERVNRISKSAQSGQASENLLEAGGAEIHDDLSDASSKWELISGKSNNNNAVITTEAEARTGCASLKTWVGTKATASDNRIGLYQTVTLTSGVTYNFSGYVNTENIVSFGTGGGVYLAFLNTNDQILAAGEKVTVNTTNTLEDGWQRINVTYKPTTSGTYRVAVIQENAVDYALFDDLQLEEVWGSASGTANGVALKTDSAPSSVNLVQNGSFLNGTQEWTMNGNLTGSDGNINNADTISHEAFAVLEANTNGMKRASQTIPINAPATETFLLSAWGRAASTAECVSELNNPENNDKRYFGLIACCNYSDSSKEYFRCSYGYIPVFLQF